MRHFVLGRARSAHVQFFRYFFVGGSSAVFDLFIYAVCLWFGIHYLVAAFVAYTLGFVWNHFLCVMWVFEPRHSRSKEVAMAFAIALGGLAWTELILYGLVDFVGIHAIVAKIISQFVVLLWNFGMRKMYVFH